MCRDRDTRRKCAGDGVAGPRCECGCGIMDGLAYVGAEWNLAVGGGGVVCVAGGSVRELWREEEGEGGRF